MQKPCFSSFYSSSWWLYPSPPSPPTQPERQGNCLTIIGMLMKTPTTSQWTLDTTFQMCHLQMGLFRSGPGHQVHFLQWKQQCHNEHQGQLVPMEHPVHRQGCANDQPRRYHQVPVEFHFSGRTPGYMTSPFLWPGKAPSAAGAMRQLQQVEFFMKIPTAECNTERRRKKLS